MTTGTRVYFVWVTSIEGTDHAVTDEVMAAGIKAGTGEYSAVCGVVVLADLMTAPPGPRCSCCVAYLRPAPSLPVKRVRRVWVWALVGRVFGRWAVWFPVVSGGGVAPSTAALPDARRPVIGAADPIEMPPRFLGSAAPSFGGAL